MNDRDVVGTEKPLLTVVVVIVSDTTDANRNAANLAGCLEALSQQIDSPPMEIIVPYKPPVEGIQDLKARFPTAVFSPFDELKTFSGQGGSREHHDELRARGLALANGEILALLEDVGRPDPHWGARMVRAHAQRYANYAAVGGAIENGIDRPVNWAVYFCDFGKYQNPIPEGDSLFASDANVSYKRSALATIKPVWQDIFQETAVNWALASRGEKLALSSEAIVYQHRRNLRLGSALKERFIWGRSYAATRGGLVGSVRRLMYAMLTPTLPAILLSRMAVNVARKGRCGAAFLKALPLTVMLITSWACGEFAGYLTAHAHSYPAPASAKIAPPTQ